jgi:hypothetical protein
MAGGVFPGQPLALNLKCVIFSFLIAGGYWYLPQKNLAVLVALLYFPYLALAWYDYYYQCNYKLQPTIFPLGRWLYLPFKPQEYKDAYANLSEEAKQTIAKWDRFFILGIIGIALTYGVYKFS